MNIKLLESFISKNSLEIDIKREIDLDQLADATELVIYAVRAETEGKYHLTEQLASKALTQDCTPVIQFGAETMLSFAELRLDPSDKLKANFTQIDNQIEALQQDKAQWSPVVEYNFHFFAAIYYTARSTYDFYRAEYRSAIEFNKMAIESWEHIDESDGVHLVMIDLQFCYSRTGRFAEGLESSNLLLDQINPEHDKLTYCHALMARAEILQLMGNFVTTSEILEESYALAQELDIEALIFHSSRFLAKIYAKQGLHSKALSIQEQNFDYLVDAPNPHFKALLLNDMGTTSRLLGNHEDAEAYFFRSIEESEKLGTYDEILTSYYNLILNETTSSRAPDQMMQYLEKMVNYKQEVRDPRYQYLPKLCRALILLSKKRLNHKFQAIEPLRNLVRYAKLYHDYRLTAIYYLIDLLLLEYRYTKEQDILDEISATLNILYDIGSNLHSYPVLIDYYILQAKLERGRGNSDQAIEYLAAGNKIAQKSGVREMINYMSKEEELLDGGGSIFHSADETISQHSIFEEISHYIKDLRRGRGLGTTPIEVDPLIVMIISQGGMNLYSKEFKPGILSDPHLVASFLTAIISFTQEAFIQQSKIEMIQIGGKKLMLQSVGELIICLIFAGYTPKALASLKKFSDKLLENSTIYSQLKRSNISSRDEKEIARMVSDTLGSLSDESRSKMEEESAY